MQAVIESAPENLLAPFSEGFDELAQLTGPPKSLRKEDLTKDRTRYAEAQALLIAQFQEAPDDVLTPFQRVAAVMAIDNARNTLSRGGGAAEFVSGKLEACDRITDDLERTRGLIALVGWNSLALYTSHGADSIKVFPTVPDGPLEAAKFEVSGNRMDVEDLTASSLPDGLPATDVYGFRLLDIRDRLSHNTWARLLKYDPAYRKNDFDFVVLGDGDKAAADLNPLMRDQVFVYSMRLLEHMAGKRRWLGISPPGELIAGGVTAEFARVYTDIIWNVPSSRFAWNVLRRSEEELQRRRAIAHFTPVERAAVLYAAGTSKQRVEKATRLRIDGLVADLIDRRPGVSEARRQEFAARMASRTDQFFAKTWGRRQRVRVKAA